MTLKQMGRQDFYQKLDAYILALKSKDSFQIMCTSLAVHSAKGNPGVTKEMQRMVGRAFRNQD